MKPLILLTCLMHLILCQVYGQERDSAKWEVRYQQIKDSLALLYPTIPAVNSVLIKEKQFEVNFYSSLLSADKYRDGEGDLNYFNFQETYLFNTLQVNYGISKHERLNIGIGIQSVTGRIDEDRNTSIFKVFSSDVEGNSAYASAVTAIIPRIRWRPFRNNYTFTMQSSLSIPINISSEDQKVLGRNQYFLLHQFIYNKPLNNNFFLLSQLTLQYGFQRENVPDVLYIPLSVYLSYFIPKKTVFFALLNYVPAFIEGGHRYTFQAGGGIQFQVSRQFLINGYYTNDLIGKNYPDFAAYTIGLRWVSK